MNNRHRYADQDLARRTIAAQKMRYRKRTGSGTGRRLRRPWTKVEDLKVLRHRIPDRELAVKLERSVQAIQVRRCRLKGRK